MAAQRERNVGFIGLGLMGRPMAKNLLKHGFPLDRAQPQPGPVERTLVAAGASAASTPAEVAAPATRIVTMVPDSPDVERCSTARTACSAPAARHRSSSTGAASRPAAASRFAERGRQPRRARCSTPRSAAARSAPSTGRYRSWSAARRRRSTGCGRSSTPWATAERDHPHRRVGRRADLQAV